MCGILGAVNRNVTPEQLASIRHRGPDRQAIENFQSGGQRVSLGHVRLSILDLSDTGNQPMVSECGNYCLIYNGEVYNYMELADRFLKRTLKGHSDTEVVLYLLIEYGMDILKRFNGIYAFAFFDLRKGEVLLARDPFGVKPLYYYRKNDWLIFSSEVRPMHLFDCLEVNKEAIYTLVDIGYLPSPLSMYENVCKVKPGHCVKVFLWNNLEMETRCYTDYYVPKIHIPFEEAVEEYGCLLEKAVERQLMSDVDLGILLSGGVDSALVAGLAARTKKIKAYTVGFENACDEDEISWATETAANLHIEHAHVKIGSAHFFDIFSECTRILEEPIATSSVIPMYYLSQLAAREVKVVLSGQGADEIGGGYGRYNEEVRFNRRLCMLYRCAWQFMSRNRGWLKSGGTSFYRRSLENEIDRFVPGNPFLISFFKSIGWHEAIKENLHGIFSSNYDLLACNQLEESAEKLMKMDAFAALPDNLLFYTDKITMNFSLECRVPLLDLELARFVQSLPCRYKVTNAGNKILQKEYARRVLPDFIVNRKKYGFQSPVRKWLEERPAAVSDRLLHAGNPLFDFFPRDFVRSVVIQYFKGDRRNEKLVFQLLSLSFWLNNKREFV